MASEDLRHHFDGMLVLIGHFACEDLPQDHSVRIEGALWYDVFSF